MSTLISMFFRFCRWNPRFIGFITVLIRGRPQFNLMPTVRARVFFGLSENFLEGSSDALEDLRYGRRVCYPFSTVALTSNKQLGLKYKLIYKRLNS